MNRIFLYVASLISVFVITSCGDQLRVDERQQSHDVNYFTYSRYQLSTAIVDVAKGYSRHVVNDEFGQLTQHFMDAYEGDVLNGWHTDTWNNWYASGQDPYTRSFRTIAAVKDLATNEGNEAHVAVADILKAFLGANTTERYGDIPFSTASQGREGEIFPTYDTQREVYEQIFDLLDGAIATLSSTSSEIHSEHDLLYNGNKSNWIKFANSLKFRLMMHSYDAFNKAGVDLKAELEAIASSSNYISSVEDNASLHYSGLEERESWPLQTNWGTGNDYTEQKVTKYLLDEYLALDDPRMYVLFGPTLAPISSKTEVTTEQVKINGFTYDVTYYPTDHESVPDDLTVTGRDKDGNRVDVTYPLDAMWFGTPVAEGVESLFGGAQVPGAPALYSNYRLTGLSQLMSLTSDYRLKAAMMEASEMMFLLAEAKAKGLISTGNASTYYENGIKLSFERWGVVDGTKPATHIDSDEIIDDYNAYCAKVALDGSNDLDKIAHQKWLSFVMLDSHEAWVDYRRTEKPAFVKTIAESFSTYSYPVRLTYPLDERNNNTENYDAAVSSMGGDEATTPMWILK